MKTNLLGTALLAPALLACALVPQGCGGAAPAVAASGGGGSAGHAATGTSSATTTTTSTTTTSTTSMTSSTTSGSGGAGGQASADLVLSSATNQWAGNPSLAVAPDGTLGAVWEGTSDGFGYSFSSDEGATWAPPRPIMVAHALGTANAELAVDPSGNFFVSGGVNLSLTPPDPVMVARCAAGKGVFGPMASIVANAPVTDSSRIVVTTDGHVVAAYWAEDAAMTASRAVVTRSADGVTWSSTDVVTSPTFLGFVALCASKTGNGLGLVTYETDQALENGNASHLTLRTSADGGQTWAAPTAIPTPPGEALANSAASCVMAGSDVWVAYGLAAGPAVNVLPLLTGIRVAHSSDGGKTIEAQVAAADALGGSRYLLPALAHEDGGAVDLVYYAGMSDGDPAASVRVARAADGKTFAPSVVIHEPVTLTTGHGADTLFDHLGAVAQGAKLHVAYSDNSSGAGKVRFHTWTP